ncbi:unnamed protein product [Gordionus sp. m RMFG-2023]
MKYQVMLQNETKSFFAKKLCADDSPQNEDTANINKHNNGFSNDDNLNPQDNELLENGISLNDHKHNNYQSHFTNEMDECEMDKKNNDAFDTNNDFDFMHTSQIKCFLCNQKFSDPRILFCLHSFCLECIFRLARSLDDLHNLTKGNDLYHINDNNHILREDCINTHNHISSNISPFFQTKLKINDDQTNAINIKCPICHNITKILIEEEEIVKNLDKMLPKDLIINDILTLNDLQKKSHTISKENMIEEKSNEQHSIYCTSCKIVLSLMLHGDQDKVAVGRCVDCGAYLCPACVRAHQYMRCFENHRVMMFAEIRAALNRLTGTTVSTPKSDGEENPNHFDDVLEAPTIKESESQASSTSSSLVLRDEEANGKSLKSFASESDHGDSGDAESAPKINGIAKKLDHKNCHSDKDVVALVNSLKCVVHCNEHPGERVKYYCDSCQFLICLQCLEIHQPPQHICLLLDSNLEDKHKKDLLQDIDTATEKMRLLEGKVCQYENKLFTLDSQQETAKRGLEEARESCKDLVDQYFSAALEELAHMHTSYELKVMEAFHDVKKLLENYEDSTEFTKKMLRRCNLPEMLSLKPFVKHRLFILSANSGLPLAVVEPGIDRPNNKYAAATDLDLTFHLDTPAKLETFLKEQFLEPFVTQRDPGVERETKSGDESSCSKSFTNGDISSLDSLEREANNNDPALTSPSSLSAMTSSLALPLNDMNPSSAFATNIMGLAALAKLGNMTLDGNMILMPDLTMLSPGLENGMNTTSFNNGSLTRINSNSPSPLDMETSGPGINMSCTLAELHLNKPFLGQPMLKEPDANGSSKTSSLNLNALTGRLNNLSALLERNNTSLGPSGNEYLTANLSRLLTMSSNPPPPPQLHHSLPSNNMPMHYNLNHEAHSNLNSLHSTPPLNPLQQLQAPLNGLNNVTGALIDGSSNSQMLAGNPFLNMGMGLSAYLQTHPPPLSCSSSINGISSNPKMSVMKVRVKFGSLGPGNLQFNSPHGFCLGVDEEIIVADTNNHRIQVYTKAGAFKGQFGIPGRDEGQLWYPRKVAVNKMNGKFVVCDRGNERSRMQIFDRNGNFLKKVPIRYIDIVAGLAITEVGSPGGAGHIVAVDSVTPTVFRIAETGDLLHWFDCSEQMREPSDVAVRGDEYYVCDFKGHCVAVFAESGRFLRRIGRESLTNFPNGIDVSEGGEVLVGDSHGNRFHVAVFRGSDGAFVAEFECPHVKVSRCCGLKITSEGHVVTLAKNNHYVLVLDTLFVPP